jgi:hypothetical protein
VVPHARPFLGRQKVCGRGAEVFPGLLEADRRRAGGVDDCVNPFERRFQPLATQQVNAERAADPYYLMPVLLEERNSARTDVARRTGYCNSNAGPPGSDY